MFLFGKKYSVLILNLKDEGGVSPKLRGLGSDFYRVG